MSNGSSRIEYKTVVHRSTLDSQPADIPLAKKDARQERKLDFTLLPYIALEKAAEALMVGELKYGRENYEDGHLAHEPIAALLRHVMLWYHRREEFDLKDGQHHLGAVIANASMILRQQELGTLVDTRPKPAKQGKNGDK